MSNYETFQAQIPNSDEFDIVICILWSRLGTPLVAPDGKRYTRAPTSYSELGQAVFLCSLCLFAAIPFLVLPLCAFASLREI